MSYISLQHDNESTKTTEGKKEESIIAAAADDDDADEETSCRINHEPLVDNSTKNNYVRGKRKNMGRSARRRRKKLLEIEVAEKRFRRDNNDDDSSKEEPIVVLPSDRGREWPGVLEQRRRLSWKDDEACMVVAQLGYLPGNAIQIASRLLDCPPLLQYLKTQSQQQNNDDNVPLVLQLYPMVVREEYAGGKDNGKRNKRGRRRQQQQDDNTTEGFVLEPFPTLYWLTHPLLRILVSKLELECMGKTLEERLQKQPSELESMKRAHLAYGKERTNLLTRQDVSVVEERHWQSAFSDYRGVGGIRNFASVKCLHAHLAHYLSHGPGAKDNVVGKWVMEAVLLTI